jgi:hypothetical protein
LKFSFFIGFISDFGILIKSLNDLFSAPLGPTNSVYEFGNKPAYSVIHKNIAPSKIEAMGRLSLRGDLIDVTAGYSEPSIHVTKSRVWTLRRFSRFLTLHRVVFENIATGIRCNF